MRGVDGVSDLPTAERMHRPLEQIAVFCASSRPLAGSILHLQTEGIRMDQNEIPAECVVASIQASEPAQIVTRLSRTCTLYVSEPFSNCSNQSSQPGLLLLYHQKQPDKKKLRQLDKSHNPNVGSSYCLISSVMHIHASTI